MGSCFQAARKCRASASIARSYLIHIGNLNWKKINPDIFGSMIQAVADDEERGALGMHYTSVPNILKVLNPLFLDDLREQLDEAGDNARKLLNLRNRMAKIGCSIRPADRAISWSSPTRKCGRLRPRSTSAAGSLIGAATFPLTNYRGIELRVRRQNIWHNSRRRLAECGPRLGVDVRRRACGVASADIRWSVA
jgi:hypothetical protein